MGNFQGYYCDRVIEQPHSTNLGAPGPAFGTGESTNLCGRGTSIPIQFSMRRVHIVLTALMMLAAAGQSSAQRSETYRGFDRNDYPGDALLPALRQSFQFTGYWLNNPPGETSNSWTGKRGILKQNGFGFLVLFNGHTAAELKGADATGLGEAEGKAAAAAAVREGFPANVIIFLDQEEGGRLTPDQATYLFAWVDAVRAAGARAGIYCSAIPVPDGPGGKTITTAQDVAEREEARTNSRAIERQRRIAIWAANDACPPSPGCRLTEKPTWPDLPLKSSAYEAAWQYAQSPRRAQFSSSCPLDQAQDGMCYAPGVAPSEKIFVDLNLAHSPDPSEEP